MYPRGVLVICDDDVTKKSSSISFHIDIVCVRHLWNSIVFSSRYNSIEQFRCIALKKNFDFQIEIIFLWLSMLDWMKWYGYGQHIIYVYINTLLNAITIRKLHTFQSSTQTIHNISCINNLLSSDRLMVLQWILFASMTQHSSAPAHSETLNSCMWVNESYLFNKLFLRWFSWN